MLSMPPGVLAELLLLAVAVAAIALVALYTVLTGSPPMPSSAKARDTMTQEVPNEVRGRIVDPGCGQGTLVFAFAKRYPRLEVVGYERSPLPWLIARGRQLLVGYSNVTLIWGDFRGYSLCGTAVVVCYLDPRVMGELRDKMESELQAGVAVFSNTFSIPGWQPHKTFYLKGRPASPVYLYHMGDSQHPKPPADAGHPRGGGRRESFPGGFLAPSPAPQTSTTGDSRHQPAVFRGSHMSPDRISRR